MIKRMSKLTSMLVAAAAVVSIVPASAATTTNLETKEGTIESAIAFDGGKYVFDGYKGDDQASGVYYSNGTTDTEIEDVDGTGVKYGNGYLDYSSDEVLFNLKNGQAEEDTAEDKQSYIETKFKSSVIKKADRYDNTQNLIAGTQLNQNQFGNVWYQYSVANATTMAAATEAYTVFVNDAGKYVDASETLNITYYKINTATGVATKVKLDTVEDLADNSLTMIEGAVIATDADYIYRTVTIVDGTTNTVFLQKISKAQGETKDGAYLPKTVASYEVAAADVASLTPATDLAVRVSGNSVYSIDTTAGNEITIKKFDLKKVKADVEVTKDNSSKVTLKLDKNQAKLDEDYDNIDGEDMTAFDIDASGNVWILHKGVIKKVVNGDLETKYTVDRTMNSLSVYDDNDIIVWNSQDEIYATVAGKTEIPVPEVPVVTTGWVKNADGTWSFNKADGTKSKGWVKDGSTWYFLNANGIMQTGWVKDGSTWYFLNASGAMKTGWVKDGANWYFLQASGAMAANTTVDGYKLGASGAWVK